MSTTATRNPIRSKAKRLLGRFLASIERQMGDERDPDAIPDLSPGQWRSISGVLATYRTMVDEHYMEQELEIAKLDLSKLTVHEIQIILARYREVEPPRAIEVKTNGGAA